MYSLRRLHGQIFRKERYRQRPTRWYVKSRKKPGKSLNHIVSKGKTGMRTRGGEARNRMRLWDPVRQNIRNIADALVRAIRSKYGCACEPAFHCWYYTKFRRKNKERNVKTGMRLWRFCASRFIPAKELLYQRRIQFFRHLQSDKKIRWDLKECEAHLL